MPRLTPTELSREVGLDRREVIFKCIRLDVPILNGRIDKERFVAALNRERRGPLPDSEEEYRRRDEEDRRLGIERREPEPVSLDHPIFTGGRVLDFDHIPIERHWGIAMRLHDALGHTEPWELCQEGCDNLASDVIRILFGEAVIND